MGDRDGVELVRALVVGEMKWLRLLIVHRDGCIPNLV